MPKVCTRSGCLAHASAELKYVPFFSGTGEEASLLARLCFVQHQPGQYRPPRVGSSAQRAEDPTRLVSTAPQAGRNRTYDLSKSPVSMERSKPEEAPGERLAGSKHALGVAGEAGLKFPLPYLFWYP